MPGYSSQLAALDAAAREKGGRVRIARARDAPRAAGRSLRTRRRPQSAAAPVGPARRRRPDGVLLPQQRSQRRLLPRDDQRGGLPADPDHDESARRPSPEANASPCPSTKPTSASSAAASPPRCSPRSSPSSGPALRITVVEAGRSIFDAQNRGRYRERALDYGEHPWHDDYIEDQQANGIISMTMAVGGLALHWGGACNRFSEEDLRLKSMYGLADDWPIEWAELERYYVRGRAAAERRRRAEPASRRPAHPRRTRRRPMPLSYNLQVLKTWAEQSGLKFSPLPMARNLTPFGGRGAAACTTRAARSARRARATRPTTRSSS